MRQKSVDRGVVWVIDFHPRHHARYALRMPNSAPRWREGRRALPNGQPLQPRLPLCSSRGFLLSAYSLQACMKIVDGGGCPGFLPEQHTQSL